MKKTRRILFIAAMAAVLLALALGLTACGGVNTNTPASKYTLTLKDGMVTYETVVAEEGADIVRTKPDPTRSNYTFMGWSLSEGGPIVPLPAKMPAANATYYAVFSASYTVRFDTGSAGTLSADAATKTVSAGGKLYDIVKEVVPTISGDATFDGWYYVGKKLEESSTTPMPNSNVIVTAKYTVGYTVKVNKQVKYDGEDYTLSETKTGTAYVGEYVDLPAYDGYRYESGKGEDIRKIALKASSADNVYNIYYKLTGYSVIFDANLPEEAAVTGAMDLETHGYNEEVEVPACDFKADGYRFLGWSTTADGPVEYRPGGGNTYTVKGVSMFFAKWYKGMTEIKGQSYDRIYLISDLKADGTSEATRTAYLERYGLDDVAGTFNEVTGIFTFKNKADEVVLRGVVNEENGTFAYLDVSSTTEYKLSIIAGTVDATTTLSLADDGTAVYKHAVTGEGGAVTTVSESGTYAFDGEEGTLKFTAENTEFAFRIGNENVADQSDNVFMIRGKEYGVWNNLAQSGVVNTTHAVMLDGYGRVTLLIAGWNSSLSSPIVSAYRGVYRFTEGEGAYDGEAGTEININIFNSSLNRRIITCLLMTGEYRANGNDDTVYNNVYLERFALNMYSDIDTDTADTIVLDGYSVLENSATYTHGGTTVTGKYEYDRYAGTLRISPESGDDLLFEVNVSEDGSTILFESVDLLFGQYMITGMFSNETPKTRSRYNLCVRNNNEAYISVMLPVSDSFYGSIAFEYYPTFFGTCTVVSETDINGKPTDNPLEYEYEFSAPISATTVNQIYYMYYFVLNEQLNLSQFGSFRFRFMFNDQGKIAWSEVSTRGDYQGGKTLIHHDGENVIEYKLDGFGHAYAVTEGAAEPVKSYSAGYVGINAVKIDWATDKKDENGKDKVDSVEYYEINGQFLQYKSIYNTYNANTRFIFMMLEGDMAVVMLNTSSGLRVVTWGSIKWEVKDKFGTFTQIPDVSELSNIYVGMGYEYSKFSFGFITLPGSTSQFVFLFDGNGNIASQEDHTQTVTCDAGTIEFDYDAATAKYTDKSGAVHEGRFSLRNDTVMVAEPKVANPVSEADYNRYYLKLKYSGDSIVGFTEVTGEVGYYLSLADSRSYLYLSGEVARTEGSGDEAVEYYGATYYEYTSTDDDGVRHYTEYTAEYRPTSKAIGLGYDVTYGDGKTMTVDTAVEVSGFPLFLTYKDVLNSSVYRYDASTDTYKEVARLSGGGYSNQTIALTGGKSYSGTYAATEREDIFTFTTSNGDEYYFRQDSERLIMLDGTVIAESNFGLYEFEEPVEVTVGDRKISATSLEMLGDGYAYLHYLGEGATPDIRCEYAAYSSSNYVLVLSPENGETVDSYLMRFRIMYRTLEDDTRTYFVQAASEILYGTFTGNDLSVIVTDGFGTSYYVDASGRRFVGSFTVVDGKTDVICIRYADLVYYVNREVYVRIDAENKTYEIIDKDTALA